MRSLKKITALCMAALLTVSAFLMGIPAGSLRVRAEDAAIRFEGGTVGSWSGTARDLMDGITGRLSEEGTSWSNGTWLRAEGFDLTIWVNLQQPREIQSLSMGFLDEWEAGGRFPQYVEYAVSMDDQTYTDYDTVYLNEPYYPSGARMKTVTTDAGKVTAQYLKIFIKNGGKMPDNHPSRGADSWLFFDELTIREDIQVEGGWQQRFGDNGKDSLMDGITGALSDQGYTYTNGTWSGAEAEDVIITVALPFKRQIRSLSMGFLDEWACGVRYPEYVRFSLSDDGQIFSEFDTVYIEDPWVESPARMKTVTTDAAAPVYARYIRIFLKNPGRLPDTHPSAGGTTWMFFDELEISTQTSELDLSFVSSADNDLYQVAFDNYTGVKRYDTLSEAIAAAGEGTGIAVLADAYPDQTAIDLTGEEYALIESKGLRLYIEYPANNENLGIAYDGSEVMGYNRAVVTDAEALGMENHSLLYVNGARFIKKTDVSKAWLVSARVVGYDTASYGLTNCTPYSLLEVDGNVMVAATKLSQFLSAGYAPYERYQKLWSAVFTWLTDSDAAVPVMEWQAVTRPAYSRDEPLGEEAYLDAIRANADWFFASGFILSDEDAAYYDAHRQNYDKTYTLHPGGDGRHGVAETYLSGASFQEDGSQSLRMVRRADCNGETAGALALAYQSTGNELYRMAAYNIMNWLLTESDMSLGARSDPASPEYGLIAWDDEYGGGSYYGDDNARAILGLISAASALETDEFDDRILAAILANFRTTGVYGFRGDYVSSEQLKDGWESLFNTAVIHYAPHFEALMWACYLWAYEKTEYEPLLELTRAGIERMMQAYEDEEWAWTNGMQQERAKMLLPLSWLCRIEDTEQHRNWLDTMVTDLCAYQQDSGAIQEAIGKGSGRAGKFTSNDQYGTHEAPVIQENGDPCVDNLYTQSFALLGLNEAAAASSDAALTAKITVCRDKLAEFFIRTQQVSENTAYDGVWFRAFDYEKWETYGSDGDSAWGVWATESGWTEAWINHGLSMIVLDANLWDLSADLDMAASFETLGEAMLTDKTEHAYDILMEFTSKEQVDRRYGSGGIGSILDGVTGTMAGSYPYANGTWTGFRNTDIVVTIDLKEPRTFGKLTLGFLEDWNNGIMLPSLVRFFTSQDGESFTAFGTCSFSQKYADRPANRQEIEAAGDEVTAQYIRIVITNPGGLPNDHPDKWAGSWLFFDELTVEGMIPEQEPIQYDPANVRFGENGKESVMDGVTGRLSGAGEGYSWMNGTWSGIEGSDLTITVDLKEEKRIASFSMGFLDEWPSGVRFPEYVRFSISTDGLTYTDYDTVYLQEDCFDTPARMKTVTTDADPAMAQFVKVLIKNGGPLPDTHPENPGTPTWIFFDELGIQYAPAVEPPPESNPSTPPESNPSTPSESDGNPSDGGSRPSEPSQPGSAPSSDIGNAKTGRPVSGAAFLAAALVLTGLVGLLLAGKAGKKKTSSAG